MATDTLNKPREIPALRVKNEPDDLDDKRASWAWRLFTAQDAGYRNRDRAVEESVRMLAGQQWMTYHHLLGWKDITQFMSDEEKRRRQRPVFNRILPWFILTHARMTENPFICTFLPGPDRKDALLAEINDILYKAKWRAIGMGDVWDRAAAWMIVSGDVTLGSRIDLTKGPWEKWIGRATLPLMDLDDLPVIGSDAVPVLVDVPDGVPFDAQGQPLAIARADESGGYDVQVTGEPHAERRGALMVDVYPCMQVRGEWGAIPWHQQRRHIVRSYLTPEEVFERWGVEVEPDVTGDLASNVNSVERLLFGSGFFGSASAVPGSESSQTENTDGYVCVQTQWMAPNKRVEGMEETPTAPGGRLLVTTQTKVLHDGPRPFAYKHTSSLRRFEFVRVPGRMGGTTPQESMNSPQRAYNQGGKQILENRALCTNPQQVYDQDSGIQENQIDNRPGRVYGVRMKPGLRQAPIQWLVPPQMGADVWRSQDWLGSELQFIGASHNTQPTDLSKDASGELVRELRLNDDRFLGPTMRRAAEEMGRLIEDWVTMWPTIHDREEVLQYTGEDNIARTVTLLPDLFEKSHADVEPDLESMLPEGRGERRARIYKMWQDGAFGEPLSPGALRKFHELAKFPHMSRAARPGGIHWTTAEQENGELLQGQLPPIWDWYDHGVHLTVHEEFMASPEFRRLSEPTKLGFILHRQEHLMRQAQQMMDAAEAEVGMLPPPAPAGTPPGKNPPPVPAAPGGGIPTPPKAGTVT